MIYWNKKNLFEENNNMGGATSGYPLIPYHMSLPLRAFCDLSVKHAADFMLLFHEYFHTVENAFDLKSGDEDENLISYYPPYEKDKNLYDYWEFMFSNQIPKVILERSAKGNNNGWKGFSYSTNYPLNLSKEAFQYNMNAVKDVTLENRKRSRDLQKEAGQAWAKGNLEQCDKLYRNAIKMNPALFDYYMYFGDRASQAGNYAQAAEYYKEYFRFTESAWHAKLVADLDR
jgi:hypothetical protein